MQLFVVHNPKTGTVYVFDSHEVALRCRRDQGLDDNYLHGCVIFTEWEDGQPHNRLFPTRYAA